MSPLFKDTVHRNIHSLCTPKKSSLHVEQDNKDQEVMKKEAELSPTSDESPSQFRIVSIKRTVQDIISVVCQKQH